MLRSGRPRRSVLVATVVVLSGLLAGCTLGAPDTSTTRRTEPTVDVDSAKQRMIEAVDDATARLGGVWKPRTGPDYAEDCVLPDGEQGARWRYLTGSELAGDPTADGARMADHWRAQGMEVVVRDSEDGLAVFGSGGDDIAGISVYAYSGNSTVQALSRCFPGDADRIMEQLSDE
ncbi:hypothetical protein HP467_08105 [Curtobacterium albidum]|uniref:Lipoprotein n=1 Tax=Curtobacterium citreum TaxID=2036 RepID=A0A850DUB9_9MICO|nr:hypothetical protein [Curtobacterium albidum]NUU28075.1 hypothetical protein [Curtobacterium albidum]